MIARIPHTDALLVVDVQNDFLPGGRLAVAHSQEVIPILNRYIAGFVRAKLPIFATRDWHPAQHCSFREQGGPWPSHCIMETAGAQFPPSLRLPSRTVIISKANSPDKEAYSGFEGSELEHRLREAGVRSFSIGGLTTDYCVLNTVRDGLRKGFKVTLLADAIRAVNVHPTDGRQAVEEMLRLGAIRFELTAPTRQASVPAFPL